MEILSKKIVRIESVEVIEKKIEVDLEQHKNYIAERVIDLRKTNLISRSEAARRMGFTISKYRDLEIGKYPINLMALRKLCEYYKCESKEILGF